MFGLVGLILNGPKSFFPKESYERLVNYGKINKTQFPRKESKFKEVPYQKLGRFIAAFGSCRSKTLKTVNFGQIWQNFCLMAKILPNQNFPGIQSMIPQRRPQEQLPYHKLGDSQPCLEVICQELSKLSILAKNGLMDQILPYQNFPSTQRMIF